MPTPPKKLSVPPDLPRAGVVRILAAVQAVVVVDDVVADAAVDGVVAGGADQHVVAVDAVDGDRDGDRRAARDGVGEGVGRLRVARARTHARQIVEGVVRIVGVGAVGVDGEQRAGGEHDLGADIGAASRSRR